MLSYLLLHSPQPGFAPILIVLVLAFFILILVFAWRRQGVRLPVWRSSTQTVDEQKSIREQLETTTQLLTETQERLEKVLRQREETHEQLAKTQEQLEETYEQLISALKQLESARKQTPEAN